MLEQALQAQSFSGNGHDAVRNYREESPQGAVKLDFCGARHRTADRSGGQDCSESHRDSKPERSELQLSVKVRFLSAWNIPFAAATLGRLLTSLSFLDSLFLSTSSAKDS